MMLRSRPRWDRHVEQIIRSQHYTRLGEGLAGECPSIALAEVLADIMHICDRQGLSFDALVERASAQYELDASTAPEQFALPGGSAPGEESRIEPRRDLP